MPDSTEGHVLSDFSLGEPPDWLDRFRKEAALSHGELWLRYFELGGMSTAFEIEAVLHGALVTTDHDHNMLAHALNERFVEMGGNHPVRYLGDGADG